VKRLAIETGHAGSFQVLRSVEETEAIEAVKPAQRQGKKPHSFFLDLFSKDTADAQAALYRKPLINSDRWPILRC